MGMLDIIISYINILRNAKPGSSVKVCYEVAQKIMKKYPEETEHMASEMEYWKGNKHLEALLPFGAKLVRTRRNKKHTWFLYCYHFCNADGVKVLQAVL